MSRPRVQGVSGNTFLNTTVVLPKPVQHAIYGHSLFIQSKRAPTFAECGQISSSRITMKLVRVSVALYESGKQPRRE